MNPLELARDTIYTYVGLIELARLGLKMRQQQQAAKRAAAGTDPKQAASTAGGPA